MTHEETQAKAQKITDLLAQTFPEPKQAIGYLLAALVQYFDKMHYTEQQMARSVIAGARALKAHIKKNQPIVQVVTPEEYRKEWS